MKSKKQAIIKFTHFKFSTMSIKAENINKPLNLPLLIASVGSSAYFAILGSKYIVVHASTMGRALEWLDQAGYQWSSVEKITPTNIY